MRKENACDILEENGGSHPQESNGLDLMFTGQTNFISVVESSHSFGVDGTNLQYYNA